MKFNFKKILPVLLLTIVILGAVIGTSNKAYAYDSQYAYNSGDTVQQINSKLSSIDDWILSIDQAIKTKDLLNAKGLLLNDKLLLLQKKQSLSPDLVNDQNITDVQNKITETTTQLENILLGQQQAIIRPLADIQNQYSNIDNLSFDQIKNALGAGDLQSQMEARRVSGNPELIKEIPELINLQLAIIDKAIIKYPEHKAELEKARQIINNDRSTVHTDSKINTAAAEAAGTCGFSATSTNVGNCLRVIISWIGALLVWVFSRITWFANELFNQSINISVRTFSDYANMDAVKVSWGVIRDLVNMGFIFVLLYIAIGTMLGLSRVDWKKTVPKLIIVALLVNFSMFFTRVVIDISNITANQFYTSAAQGTTSSKTSTDGKTITGAPDVTTAIFKNIKVFSKNWLFAKSIGQDINSSAGAPGGGAVLGWKQIFVGTFGAMILAVVASFVLLTGAILFIIRTLRLLFLIILSPFAFFFMILPKTEGYAKQWWGALMNDATFAPAFLIMIYIVTKISGQIGKTGSTDDGSVIFFLLIIGLLLGAIIVAKKLGAAGAAGAMKLAGAGNAALTGGALWGLKQARRTVLGGALGTVGGVAGAVGGDKVGGSARKYFTNQFKNIGLDTQKIWDERGQSKIAKATRAIITAPGRTLLTKASDVIADQSEEFGVPVGFMGDAAKARREAEKVKKDAEKDEKEKKEAEKAKKISEAKDKIRDLNKKHGEEIKSLQEKHLNGTATDADKTKMISLLSEILDHIKNLDNKAKVKLGGDVLSLPGVAGVLAPGDLKQVSRDAELTGGQIKEMTKAIRANRANNPAAADYIELSHENKSFWGTTSRQTAPTTGSPENPIPLEPTEPAPNL